MRREAFFAKFDTFAALPGSVEKTRKLILRLAVQGRLLSQNESDEPAQAAVSRLPVLPPPARFDKRSRAQIDGIGAMSVGLSGRRIPIGWSCIPLIQIAKLESGHTPSRTRRDWWDGNIPWVGLVDARLHDGRTIHNTLQHTNEAGLANSAARLLPAGTVCISRTASVGYVVVLGRPMATSQDFVNWFPTSVVISDWLRMVFTAEKDGFARFSKGAVHQTIYYPEWLSMHVMLPPLAEQKRIVAKVEELMALCDRLEAQQKERETRHAALARASLSRFADAPTPANLTFLFHKSYAIPPADLRKTILTLAIQGKLVTRVSEVPFVEFGSLLAEASVNGVSKGPTSDTSGTEILRISAGTSRNDFYTDEGDFKHVDLPASEVEKFRLAPGDLLACRFNGNLHFVGRFSLYRGESGRVQVNPDKLIRFRVDTERCYPRYVCYAMNAPPTRESIEAMCATTAGNIGLSAGRLKTVKIPVPPLREQHGIVAEVDELMALVDELETQLAASRATAETLLDAIVGELTS